jgi:DNA modification methylase
MAGSGTTLVECKLLGRRAVGVDINPDAVMVARNRLDFAYMTLDADYHAPEIKTYVGDARSLDLIESESIDLITTHLPYASIIPYSHNCEGDLSSVHNIAEFAAEMCRVAQECMRVLKPGKHCAILIGDTRRSKHFVPITPRVLMSFLEAKFILREDIIKLHCKMKSTRKKWFGKNMIFTSLGMSICMCSGSRMRERTTRFRESMKWW